jgi:hypothetical protein
MPVPSAPAADALGRGIGYTPSGRANRPLQDFTDSGGPEPFFLASDIEVSVRYLESVRYLDPFPTRALQGIGPIPQPPIRQDGGQQSSGLNAECFVFAVRYNV